jgi:hypothetical protein
LLNSFLIGKKSDGVTNMLHEHFASVPNPYATALQIMWSCGDVHQCKSSSLSYTG